MRGHLGPLGAILYNAARSTSLGSTRGLRYAKGVPSGLAHWLGCALIVLATSCDPLSFGEEAHYAIVGDGGDGGATVDDTLVVPDASPPIDMPTEGPPPDASPPIDMPTEGPPPDAMVDAAPDAMVDAAPDASLPPDAGPPGDGGPGDGSLSDALNPDARQPPGLPVGGSHDDEIHSFYACSTGDGASALPLLLAILALRRRRR